MGNIRIGARLVLAFGALVLLTIGLGVYSLSRYAVLQELSNQVETRDFASLENVMTLSKYEDQLRSARTSMMLAGFLKKDKLPSDPPDTLQRRWLLLRDQNLRVLTDLDNSMAQWESSAANNQRALGWRKIRGLVTDTRKAFDAATPEVEALFSLVIAGNLAEAANHVSTVERSATAYEARLAELQRAIREHVEAGHNLVDVAEEQTRNSVILVLLITTVTGAAFAFLIHRSIVQPLREFSTVVERIGQGDLTQRIAKSGADEISALGRSLDQMVSGLKSVATQTRSVAESLNSATAEILASTQQQAAGTAEQATAVQQANATMAEISQSGAQISERARQVATAAEAAATASTLGMDSVRSTAAIMSSIREQAEAVAQNVLTLSEKTQAIGEIITSVNEIAEQSHLLAVNAAIQAVAAGEHGRGFSVVANEIRNLAAQSKQATTQVRSILGDIQKGITTSVMLTEEAVKRVESGQQRAGVAERTIQDLSESIEESIRAFQQIVGGSSQQQIGFDQVTQAFRSIGIASQQTVTSTKQLERAAADLNGLSQQLREAVERYRV